MSSRSQKLLARANWYLQFSLKHIIEQITSKENIIEVVVTDRFHCIYIGTSGNHGKFKLI